ncbi:phenylalanine--tRNA ligase subunit beta [Gorillibacterium timonense]|uniref:phenylalanine--tRNA ligase subunit beta n=1 Tax=Gorillibacterium timonense TaxID=1689269 RepID=UPI00071C8BAE|nr:phenylalanine--tRNA ligase subunit beta [Gorillibacterium timonense]
MKVSYRWLSEYVDVTGYSAEELAEKLTRSGVEVDEVEKLNKGVEGVVVGYVAAKEKHPDADKLNVCTVDVGLEAPLQIVCGAKNVAAGQKVPVAMIGAKLPDGLVIKRAKLRGVESQGMICSAKELGLNDKFLPKEIQEGILVLPEATPVGASALDVLNIDDEVLELDLTPNRSDCLSMLGTAYEIAAIIGRDVKLPDPREGLVEKEPAADSLLSVSISAPEACDRYLARVIEGVKIGPSPLWMQNRLMAAGVRPINNVVDITNYVMLEYGQPLHAFDADKVAGGRIDVRFAREGEKLVTLDDSERELLPSMLLITDAEKPIAIAGVMGGANSEVTGETVRIALESARFSGASVRRTSRQLGLRSEASLRFEKEVNAEAVEAALDRAASLLCQYAGGSAKSGNAEAVAKAAEPVNVVLSLAKVNGYLGTELTAAEVSGVLDRLHFTYETAGDTFTVHIPGRRGDITRDVDLIEEVARLHGYDNIPTTLMYGVTTPGSLNPAQKIRRAVRNLFAASGLNEVISYSLTHPSRKSRFPGTYLEAQLIPLAMPMSEERSVLRTSLIPGLLDVAEYNSNRNQADIALFEIGKVYLTNEKTITRQPEEKQLLSALLIGNRTAPHWQLKQEKVDFYDLKGLMEKLTTSLGIADVLYRSAAPVGFHPGRTAEVFVKQEGEEVFIGRIGQLHPSLQGDLPSDAYLLEVELDTLIRLAGPTVEFHALPRYPAITRDLAIVVERSVPVGAILETARTAAGSLLEFSDVFDIYTGDRLGNDRKSVALSLVYRHPERTLTDEEVTLANGKVLEALEQTFAAELRK